MKTLYYDTLVIGSGVAGFNAIDWLTDLDITNVALVTEEIYKGTSRNTGSDKQTYYKYGQFVGYKTNYDPKQRAITIAGPLISKFVTEALEKKVKILSF